MLPMTTVEKDWKLHIWTPPIVSPPLAGFSWFSFPVINVTLSISDFSEFCGSSSEFSYFNREASELPIGIKSLEKNLTVWRTVQLVR